MFTQLPKLVLEFNEKEIPFKDFKQKNTENSIPNGFIKYFETQLPKETCMGETSERQRKREYFNQMYQFDNRALYTLTAKIDGIIVKDCPKFLNTFERLCGGSFPQDYDFLKVKPYYLIGMSVPPLMTAKISEQIYKQWLSLL